ncbi:hypothetical protein [Amycolatopsis sp. NBC_00438]
MQSLARGSGQRVLRLRADDILDAIDEDAETDGEPEAAASADEAGRG